MRREELAEAATNYIARSLNTLGPTIFGREAFEPIMAKSRERFLGVGAEQYQISETEQSFERSSIGTMLVGKIEELVDDINYAAMIDILIERRIWRLNEDGAEDYRVVSLLESLREDLRDATFSSACAAVLLNRYVGRLVSIGYYERRAEGDYVSQLAAECEEAGAPMVGAASGRGSREIEASYARKNLGALSSPEVAYRPSPDTPAGLDEIVGEFESFVESLPGEEFISIPASEYRAGVAYIRELEARFSDDERDDIRAETLGDADDRYDDHALSQWFDDGGGD